VLEIPDHFFDDPADQASGGRRRTSGQGERGASPLRPWGMWGGLAAVGVVCAATVAHAVSLAGRAVSRAAS
jgi:hypothetical protein